MYHNDGAPMGQCLWLIVYFVGAITGQKQRDAFSRTIPKDDTQYGNSKLESDSSAANVDLYLAHY